MSLASHFRSYDAGDAQAAGAAARGGPQARAPLCCERSSAEAQRPDLWFTYHLYHKAPDWLGPLVTARLGIPYVVAEASYAPKQAGGRWDARASRGGRGVRRAALILQPNPADAECVLPLLDDPERMMPCRRSSTRRRFACRTAGRAALRSARWLGLDEPTPWLLTVAMMREDQKLLSYRCSRRR